MYDFIKSLGEIKVFTKLDTPWRHWQAPIAEKDQDKTTFTNHIWTYRYKRMTLGLRNLPSAF